VRHPHLTTLIVENPVAGIGDVVLEFLDCGLSATGPPAALPSAARRTDH
jgi:hypothetical protein